MLLVGKIGLWLVYVLWGIFGVVIVSVLYLLPLYRWVRKKWF